MLPKILFLDVETAPNLASVWGMFKQNISVNQLIETSRVLCYTAMWKGQQPVFDSEYKSGHISMMEGLHDLLSEADIVVHYNGNSFDIPVTNREFLRYSMPPPVPYKNVDLYLAIKKKFRFTSHKLDHIVQELGIGKKAETGGHTLWLACMEGDEEAWKVMEKYNKQDVTLLEPLYERILPWIDNHPNVGLYTKGTDIVCPNCGGTHYQKRGMEHLRTQSYQRYLCTDCNTWFRGRTTSLSAEKRKNVVVQVAL